MLQFFVQVQSFHSKRQAEFLFSIHSLGIRGDEEGTKRGQGVMDSPGRVSSEVYIPVNTILHINIE